MDEKESDEEMLLQMLDWLNWGMDADGRFPEVHDKVHASAELTLTKGDYAFLREYKIVA